MFQHFPDREALFEAVAREQYDRVMPTLRPIDSSLPLPERVEQFSQQRGRLYERIGGVRRAALLIEHESTSVAGWLATARQAKAAEAERVFRRELDAIPADEREPRRAALIAHCSWSAWESWRTHQRPRRRPRAGRAGRRHHRATALARTRAPAIAWSACSKRTAVMPSSRAASQLASRSSTNRHCSARRPPPSRSIVSS